MGLNMSKVLLSVGAGGAASLIFYALWRSDQELDIVPRPPYLGLRNCGNSCFLNAILQALASCKFLHGWLRLKDDDSNNASSPYTEIKSYRGVSYPLIAAMHRAILIINREIDADDDIYAGKVPGDVLHGLRHYGHRVGVHLEQDAYEFFHLITMVLNYEVEQSIRRKQVGSVGNLTSNPLDDEEGPFSFPVASTEQVPRIDLGMGCGDWALLGDADYRVTDGIYSKRRVQMKMDYKASPKSPFYCLMFSQMQCLLCMTKTQVKLEASDSITLPLPPSETCRGISLNDLLENYMKPTLLHNVECDNCSAKAVQDLDLEITGGGYMPKSSIKTTFIKYYYVAKLPNTLCFHIPRCFWEANGLVKRTEHVRFTDRLNLGDLKRLYDTQTDDGETEEIETLRNETSETGLRRFRNSEYHLVAVISHVGSEADGGHFVTFRRKQEYQLGSMMWYYISDEMVRPISFSMVMSTKAYMLFYEKSHVSA